MSLFRINKKRVLSYSRNKSLYLKNSRDVYIEKSFFLSIKIFIIKSMTINLLKLSELLKIITAMLNSILWVKYLIIFNFYAYQNVFQSISMVESFIVGFEVHNAHINYY